MIKAEQKRMWLSSGSLLASPDEPNSPSIVSIGGLSLSTSAIHHTSSICRTSPYTLQQHAMRVSAVGGSTMCHSVLRTVSGTPPGSIAFSLVPGALSRFAANTSRFGRAAVVDSMPPP